MNDWGYNGRVALGGEIAESTVRKHDWGVCEDRSPAPPGPSACHIRVYLWEEEKPYVSGDAR
ncbi:hypothetical protein SK128_013531 [Halocaridina rubra]|uniref:Uncharacterized protein n=1 Tax=Halocaridina rubra TaxID=373956 RepID=A0AAN8XVD5_HALRR